ncbi:hypothetical protein BDV18DRAFT_158260 [Aspergillus unguis]
MRLLSRISLPLALFIGNVLGQNSTIIVPDHAVNETSNVQFISSSGLDGPKVVPVNATTWDWWYFDAVQVPDPERPDERASVVVTFYTAQHTGFDMLTLYETQGFTSLTLAEVAISWPNGTLGSYFFNATEARITTAGDGASGVWLESEESARFIGTPDMSRYRLELNSSVIEGSIELQSTAPAHYPCGPNEENQTMEVAPHIGWSNAIPDGTSDVKLRVEGEDLSFTGIAYHDKNWSDRNFVSEVGVWYWGHAHVGNYSIVWFDYLSPAPELERHVSAYVARDNHILTAQCSGISARPYGENSTYPPHRGDGLPEGFDVNVDIPGEDALHVRVQAQTKVTAGAGSMYARWIGPAWAVVDGRNNEIVN